MRNCIQIWLLITINRQIYVIKLRGFAQFFSFFLCPHPTLVIVSVTTVVFAKCLSSCNVDQVEFITNKLAEFFYYSIVLVGFHLVMSPVSIGCFNHS